MPVYQYRCDQEHTFEVTQGFANKARRIISQVNVLTNAGIWIFEHDLKIGAIREGLHD